MPRSQPYSLCRPGAAPYRERSSSELDRVPEACFRGEQTAIRHGLNLLTTKLFHDLFAWKWTVVILLAAVVFPRAGSAQILPPADTLHTGRLKGAAIGLGTGYLTAMIGLNELWYKDYEGQSFHLFDDSDHWLQMDKAGHLLTGYQVSRYGSDLFRWAGLLQGQSALWGGGVSLFFLTSVEVFDGFSRHWGFSISDAAANVGGVALFVGQEWMWQEQRIIPKFSYSPTDYPDLRPETLGATAVERVLKDYNGQRIWLTVMPRSFGLFDDVCPPWLGVSVGYGASGMLGGSENPIANDAGTELPRFDRYRRLYLSLDVDLNRIPTRSNFLRSVFGVIGFIKVPAPALEWSQGSLKGHWLLF